MQLWQVIVGIEHDRNNCPLSAVGQRHGVDQTYRLAATAFGGYTAVCGHGGWINPEGTLVEERCVILSVATDDGPSVLKFAQHVGRLFEQRSVMIVCGGSGVEFHDVDYSLPSAKID